MKCQTILLLPTSVGQRGTHLWTRSLWRGPSPFFHAHPAELQKKEPKPNPGGPRTSAAQCSAAENWNQPVISGESDELNMDWITHEHVFIFIYKKCNKCT